MKKHTDGHAKLHSARKSAERYLLSLLRSQNPRPSLIQAVAILTKKEYGIPETCLTLARNIRQSALEFDETVRRLSWRGFIVGGMGIALISFSDQRFSWFVRGAWNTKPNKNDGKFCAEQRCWRAALKHHCSYMLGTYTCGEPREEDVKVAASQGLPAEQAILRICQFCRDAVNGRFSRLFIPESQFMVCRADNIEICSRHTFDELCSQNGDHTGHHQ